MERCVTSSSSVVKHLGRCEHFFLNYSALLSLYTLYFTGCRSPHLPMICHKMILPLLLPCYSFCRLTIQRFNDSTVNYAKPSYRH